VIVQTSDLDVLETPFLQYVVRPSGDSAIRNVLSARLRVKSFAVSQALDVDESSAS
jgi:hypothetical protein